MRSKFHRIPPRVSRNLQLHTNWQSTRVVGTLAKILPTPELIEQVFHRKIRSLQNKTAGASFAHQWIYTPRGPIVRSQCILPNSFHFFFACQGTRKEMQDVGPPFAQSIGRLRQTYCTCLQQKPWKNTCNCLVMAVDDIRHLQVDPAQKHRTAASILFKHAKKTGVMETSEPLMTFSSLISLTSAPCSSSN